MENEPQIRLLVFVTVLITMAVLEALLPRRTRTQGRGLRWFSNLSLVAVGTVVIRLALPISAVALARLGEQRGWGLLNHTVLPDVVEAAIAFVLLDLAIYLQHVMFHAVPALWRLHRMHHADLDFDVTTGVRFHPLELVLSVLIKCGVVVALGPSVIVVIVFEIALNASSLFNHANLRLPEALDRYLRWIVVTPEMHRVHHSVVREETNSNFGFNLPWWDRMLGTYRARPQGGEDLVIGLEEFRDPGELRLDRMLTQPFRSDAPERARAGAVPQALIVGLMVCGGFWLAAGNVSASDLLHSLQNNSHQFDTPALFVLAYAIATVALLPAAPFPLAGGAMFGTCWGAIWSLVGASLGATAAFLISRHLFGRWLARHEHERIGRILGLVQRGGWRSVAFLRLVPIVPFNLLNYFLGATQVRLSTYVFTSVVCMVPAAFAYAWLGDAGRRTLSGEQSGPLQLVGAISLVVAFALIPGLLKRRGHPEVDAETP